MQLGIPPLAQQTALVRLTTPESRPVPLANDDWTTLGATASFALHDRGGGIATVTLCNILKNLWVQCGFIQ
jgi:hypothetical protein